VSNRYRSGTAQAAQVRLGEPRVISARAEAGKLTNQPCDEGKKSCVQLPYK
jgi:hypothetical protein